MTSTELYSISNLKKMYNKHIITAVCTVPPPQLCSCLMSIMTSLCGWDGGLCKLVRFREKNQFTEDAIVRFTRDKRLALQTALNYAKGVCVCVCVHGCVCVCSTPVHSGVL